jgi:hypothetical protein
VRRRYQARLGRHSRLLLVAAAGGSSGLLPGHHSGLLARRSWMLQGRRSRPLLQLPLPPLRLPLLLEKPGHRTY